MCLSSAARVYPLTCWLFLGSICGLAGAELVLQKVSPITVEQVPAYPENLIASLPLSSRSSTAEAALLCHDPTVGYLLPKGSTTLLVSFPRIENLESISFLNHGAKGAVDIAISTVKLTADSPHWRNVSKEALTSDAVKAKIGPTEAKYVRLIFNVAEPGPIAGLDIYKVASLIVANISGANRDGIGSDGKTIQEGKDFKDAKEMPAEGPAEAPPITLPQQPPFTFVPEVSP